MYNLLVFGYHLHTLKKIWDNLFIHVYTCWSTSSMGLRGCIRAAYSPSTVSPISTSCFISTAHDDIPVIVVFICRRLVVYGWGDAARGC